MSQALSDYFAREAGEYISELERLLRADEAPDTERVFRLSRGVRGSAQVAQADGIAEVAARLEGAARFVLEGRLSWSAELRERALRTVADLGQLVAVGGSEWGESEDAQVKESLSRWGGFEDVVRSPAGIGSPGGVVSFVRSEVAGLISTLEAAVLALTEKPADFSPLRELLRRVRTLRGVAGSEPLAAAIEVLEGCDELLRLLLAREIPVDQDSVRMFDAARSALLPVHHGLEHGEPPPLNSPGLDRFRALRSRLAADLESIEDPTIVSICSLFFDDSSPTVISSPVAPPSPIRQAADSPAIDDYFRSESASVLDSAYGLLAGAEMHKATDTGTVLRRVSDLAGSLGDLAETYRRADEAALSRAAQHELLSAQTPADARAILSRLRASLAHLSTAADGKPTERPPSPSEETKAEAVPIEDLLLRGESALRAALDLRPRIESLMSAGQSDTVELRGLLVELWELIELGRSGESHR